MKKYLPLLEANVQWIALGLGALFLLYMVYANLLTPRANVTINGETIPPGQVESYLKEKAVNHLAGKIKDDPRQVPKELTEKPKFVNVFPEPQPVDTIVASAMPVLRVALPDKTPNPNTPNNTTPGVPTNVQVTELPKVKEVGNLRIEASRASVDLAGAAAANANNQNAAAPVQVQAADIDYVSVAFDFPMNDLAAEFRRTKIPAAFNTSFLDVQLIRQEKDDQGNWGADVVVEKLKNSEQPAQPDPKNHAAVGGYIAWADASQDKIIQPKFYDVVKGDPWHIPGDAAAAAAAAAPAGAGGNWAPRPADEKTIRQGFDPANPPPDMTQAEKQAKYKYDVEKKRKEQAEKNRNRPQPTPTGPPGGGRGGRGGGGPGGPGGMGGGFGNFPEPPSVPTNTGIINFQVSAGHEGPMPGGPGGAPYPPRGPYPMMPGDMGPGMGGPGMGPGIGMPGPVATAAPCPTGPFDPRTLNLAVVGWAHDATVQAGKTYRYKVRYAIKNPVYGAKGLANPPTLSETYNIISKDSAWTAEVSISQRAYYYVVQANTTSGTAKFEVFTFGNGQWNKETFSVSPGDAVGTNKDGVDYATGFTVVDVRSEKGGNDQVVVLADASGNLSRKSKRADDTDATKAKLISQMAAGAAPATPAPGTPAGMPGMPGGPGFPDDRMPAPPAQ